MFGIDDFIGAVAAPLIGGAVGKLFGGGGDDAQAAPAPQGYVSPNLGTYDQMLLDLLKKQQGMTAPQFTMNGQAIITFPSVGALQVFNQTVAASKYSTISFHGVAALDPADIVKVSAKSYSGQTFLVYHAQLICTLRGTSVRAY